MEENDEKLLKQAKTVLDDGNRHRTSGMPLADRNGIPLSNKPFWQEVQSHLTERQWKWVKYFIIAELTIKEIMEIEGVSADAVKGWGRAVRQKLRDDNILRKLKRFL